MYMLFSLNNKYYIRKIARLKSRKMQIICIFIYKKKKNSIQLIKKDGITKTIEKAN